MTNFTIKAVFMRLISCSHFTSCFNDLRLFRSMWRRNGIAACILFRDAHFEIKSRLFNGATVQLSFHFFCRGVSSSSSFSLYQFQASIFSSVSTILFSRAHITRYATLRALRTSTLCGVIETFSNDRLGLYFSGVSTSRELIS